MPLLHPPIVLAAAKGDLAAVSRLLAGGVAVDSCGRWTETEDKGFYDKSWDWNSDTALCAAMRGGHTDVVRALLAAGANPTFSVCNSCDVHETPLGLAKALQAVHPACAHALLGPAFEEQRCTAEAGWAAMASAHADASLFELAAGQLLLCKASELVGELPRSAMYTLEDHLLEASQPAALACVPEGLRERVASAWRGAKKRAGKQQAASAACLKLGDLYLRGPGVAVDEAAAVRWLHRGLCSRSIEHVAGCWQSHGLDAPLRKCHDCDAYTTAAKALAALAANPAAEAGVAAAAALAAEEQRSAALLDSRLYRLEQQRAAEMPRLEALYRQEVAQRQAQAAVAQAAQDARFAEVRAREVARCAQYEPQRRASFGGGACTSRSCCDGQDYCTYWHDGKNDLPPQCRWFAPGNRCLNGERCWYNHLPAKPPRVHLAPY